MSQIIVGLGNPGEEYELTRHNAGRMALEAFRKKEGLEEWHRDGKLNALASSGTVAGGGKILLIEPETFMNKSGASLKSLVTSKKKAEGLIVVHDDLDLPLGKIKISFNKSAGGHRGVQSVVKAVGTEAFTRVRVGITPLTPSGKLKKPRGEEGVNDFIVGTFKPKELEAMKKISKQVAGALRLIVDEGRDRAMGEFNSK